MGTTEEQIESLICNLLEGARSLLQEKTVDLLNQLFELSESESIPPTEVPSYVTAKTEQKKRLEEEIQKAGAILEEKNVDIQTIEEYKKSKNELKKYGLSIENPHRFVSVLQTIDRIGGDPRKIIRELSRVKSLKRTEGQLKKSCMMLESRISHCREVLPMCEQIMRLRIGFPELLAFHVAVMKKSGKESIPMETAAYRVMEDIENYNRIGDLKNEISKLVMQKYTIDQISAPRNKAITALIKLQSYAVTDEEILNIHELLIRARLEISARVPLRSGVSASGSSLFKSNDLNAINYDRSNFNAPK